MKYFAAVAALAAIVSAQGISDLPSCSLQCIITGVTGTGCSVTDFKCACGKASQLTSSVTPCVKSACPSAADQAKVITVLEGICTAAGVGISIDAPGASSTPAPPAVTAISDASSAIAPPPVSQSVTVISDASSGMLPYPFFF
jgi:hypothetical protein